MKNLLLASIILIAWGLVKVPWETRIESKLQRVQYGAFVPVEVRAELGQGLALAALGGFRGLAANFIWLKVTEAWEKTEWVRLRTFAEMAVLLQPRVSFFWEMGAWHMAWNASSSVGSFSKNAHTLKNKVEAQRWIEAGKDFLAKGLQALPEDASLFLKMGDLYWQKLNDPRTAAEYYKEAAKRPNALPFIERYVGVALEAAGDDQAAYDYYLQQWKERNDPHALHPRYPSRNKMLKEQIQKLGARLGKEKIF